MKKLAILAAAAFAATACTDEIVTKVVCPVPEDCEVVSFESREKMLNQASGEAVLLGPLHYTMYGGASYDFEDVFCAKAHAALADFDGPLFSDAAQRIFFDSYYAADYDAWGGFALSANVSKATGAADLIPLQFSVYADGGARGTRNFAVCYDSNSPSEMYPEYQSYAGYPTIELTEAREPAWLFIANSTYTANYYQGKDGKKFVVRITGWLGDTEGESIEVALVDDGRIREGWQLVDLWQLGRVDKLVFKVVVADYTQEPTFFCIDELTFRKNG